MNKPSRGLLNAGATFAALHKLRRITRDKGDGTDVDDGSEHLHFTYRRALPRFVKAGAGSKWYRLATIDHAV